MTKKEILKAMFDAVLDAEELTGGHIFFDYSPHVEGVGVFTYTTKVYKAGAEIEVLLDATTEVTKETLDALRWRLLPENLRKVWCDA